MERHGDLGRDLATAGPVAVTENWSSVRSDSAHHCVLWISEWPRSLVYPGFLAPVLLSSGVRRTFTLLYTPMRTDQAARDIRKKKTEYISDAAQRQRIGQIEDAQQSAEYNDVLQQEADLTAGHGILRTTGLIAVSAQDPDELERAVADIEQAAIQASCETTAALGPAGPGVLGGGAPALPSGVVDGCWPRVSNYSTLQIARPGSRNSHRHMTGQSGQSVFRHRGGPISKEFQCSSSTSWAQPL